MFYMAACQIVAQCTMTVVAAIVGRLANTWGRLPVFMIGAHTSTLAMLRNQYLCVHRQRFCTGAVVRTLHCAD